VKLKSSKHVSQTPSSSSVGSDSLATGAVSDDNVQSTKKKKHARTGSSSKLPVGVSPHHAAKILPSSVKNALGNHAQSESMGYLVLLPHEVVQLNEVISLIVTLLTIFRIISHWKRKSTP
jgi:hypothetical protein